MGGTGFIDNIPTLDDDEDNGPPPVKKKKDPEPDYTNMPIEEILDKEAENDSLNQLLKKAVRNSMLEKNIENGLLRALNINN